jgi:programmed cell death 6-interacting protein
MLALPLKRAEPTMLSSSLQPFLQKEYSAAEASKWNQDLLSFQQYRQSAITTTIASEQIGIQHLLHYHYHLKTLTKRLACYESEIKFSFTWSEAFRPNNRVTSASLFTDWAGVLWNLAALESHKGSMIDRSTDEGIRSASLQFQSAAGTIDLIRSEITPKILGPKGAELQDLFLQMMAQLMLAQAQICFYEKAIRDRRTTGTFKPALIAKLAQQVAVFYSSAVEMCREREVSTAIDISWVYHMEFQRDCFRGVSEYWQSVACKEEALQRCVPPSPHLLSHRSIHRGVGYGEEITRLRKADTILTQVTPPLRFSSLCLSSLLPLCRRSLSDAKSVWLSTPSPLLSQCR